MDYSIGYQLYERKDGKPEIHLGNQKGEGSDSVGGIPQRIGKKRITDICRDQINHIRNTKDLLIPEPHPEHKIKDDDKGHRIDNRPEKSQVILNVPRSKITPGKFSDQMSFGNELPEKVLRFCQ